MWFQPVYYGCEIYDKLSLEIRQLDIKLFKKKIVMFLLQNPFYNVNEFLNKNWTCEDFSI